MSLLLSTGAFASSLSAAASPAMVLINPTSITYSGTSATKSADGGMEFTDISSLSVNGVFTADYDTYMLVGNNTTALNGIIHVRLRSSGTDATGADYDTQYLIVNGTTESASRDLNAVEGFWAQDGNPSTRNGHITWIYSPFQAKPTAYFSQMVNRRTTMRLNEVGGLHDESISYDGFTYLHYATTFSGNLAVYGVKS